MSDNVHAEVRVAMQAWTDYGLTPTLQISIECLAQILIEENAVIAREDVAPFLRCLAARALVATSAMSSADGVRKLLKLADDLAG